MISKEVPDEGPIVFINSEIFIFCTEGIVVVLVKIRDGFVIAKYKLKFSIEF